MTENLWVQHRPDGPPTREPLRSVASLTTEYMDLVDMNGIDPNRLFAILMDLFMLTKKTESKYFDEQGRMAIGSTHIYVIHRMFSLLPYLEQKYPELAVWYKEERENTSDEDWEHILSWAENFMPPLKDCHISFDNDT